MKCYISSQNRFLDFLQIQQAHTLQEVHAAVADAKLSHVGGVGTVIKKLADRDELIQSALEFYLNGRLHFPLQE